MKQNTNAYLPVVDFLKGYSIATIVLFHLAQKFYLSGILKYAINFGGAGVHVFVLCSGFGLYLSFLKKPISFSFFLKKRFLKVYLPYIIIVFISYFIPNTYSGNDKFIALLSHIFLFKMFFEQYIGSFGPQLWFISMILQFYITFGLIVSIFRRGSFVNNIILSLLISLAWATIVGFLGKSNLRVYNSFFLQYLWEFVLGMEIAKIYHKKGTIFIPPKWVLALLIVFGVGMSGLFGVLGGWWKLYNDVPSLIGYGSLALLIYSLNMKWVNVFFIFTNKFSYEWYLIHMLLFYILFSFFNFYLSMWLIGLIAIVLSYMLAYCYHYILMKSVYKWV
ncbi:MAG: acyltransferase [Taibaiella sp.]|jgi:peptidoglycan/LPS O-acetylase OafA/YrhL